MKYVLILAFMALAVPALAQQVKVDAEPLKPPVARKADANKKGAGPEAAVKVVESDEDRPATPEEQAQLLCQTTWIMGSTTDSPVAGPDYEPGVDAYGRSVAPPSADAPGAPQYSIPDRIDIPLNIAILQTVGIVTTPTPDLSTNVGTISILKGGQVLYNDRNMTTTVQEYCDKNLKVKVDQP